MLKAISATVPGADLDRFEEMRVFASVAQLGSFSVVARQLEMSPPRVTRAVAALEHGWPLRYYSAPRAELIDRP